MVVEAVSPCLTIFDRSTPRLVSLQGLGKTVQVMALIAHLMEKKGNYGPHLIIVPNAVMVNWKAELTRWLPGVRCIYYVGTREASRDVTTHAWLARVVQSRCWGAANGWGYADLVGAMLMICLTETTYILLAAGARAHVQHGGVGPAVQRAGDDLRVHHARPRAAVKGADISSLLVSLGCTQVHVDVGC